MDARWELWERLACLEQTVAVRTEWLHSPESAEVGTSVVQFVDNTEHSPLFTVSPSTALPIAFSHPPALEKRKRSSTKI